MNNTTTRHDKTIDASLNCNTNTTWEHYYSSFTIYLQNWTIVPYISHKITTQIFIPLVCYSPPSPTQNFGMLIGNTIINFYTAFGRLRLWGRYGENWKCYWNTHTYKMNKAYQIQMFFTFPLYYLQPKEKKLLKLVYLNS